MGVSEKPSNLVDLFKSNNFLCKVRCFRVLTKFLAKYEKKIWHFVKNHQSFSIASKLASFCANYNVLGF